VIQLRHLQGPPFREGDESFKELIARNGSFPYTARSVGGSGKDFGMRLFVIALLAVVLLAGCGSNETAH